jgi:hypothetical protein
MLLLVLPAVINIQWEQDLYVFDEGVNATFMICAVTDDVIIGDRIEERLVIFRSDSAIGELSCMCTYLMVEVSLGAVVYTLYLLT